VFATYHRAGTTFAAPPVPTRLGHEFTDSGHLDVAQAMEHNDQVVGTIYLHADMSELHDQIVHYVNIVALVMIVALAASILLSSRLQRLISVPILQLAAAAKRISLERNYAIRVTKTANDELGTLYDQFNAMLEQIQQGEAAIQQAQDELEAKIEQRTAQLSRANQELSREISERLRAELELESAHQQLLSSARRAGMAEIATGVLHNVGNVLNSINVSATLASDRMRQSKISELVRVVHLLEKHREDLGSFISDDPKGKQLPGFLALLASHLTDERLDILKELDLLTTRVNHVKTIVSTQQSYAGVAGVIETVDIATTLDDALKINSASFDRHKITVVKQYAALPKVRLDKQKVLQILVNLINNAKDSFLLCPGNAQRQLTLQTCLHGEKSFQIRVIDNGIGIPAENLTRIFSHGFTTKTTGHGFGLHSCANAASEMGGSLVAESNGVGHGATFVLELPYKPAEMPAYGP